MRENPERALALQNELKQHIVNTHQQYVRLGLDDLDLLDHLKKKYGEEVTGEKFTILYGSETGNAQFAAETLDYELKRRGARTQCIALDDYDFEDLPTESTVFCLISTCGQGEYPPNSQEFMKTISHPHLEDNLLENVNFSVFALGDSSYVHFNKAGKDLQAHFLRLGAKEIREIALGDDKDEDKWETQWNEWAPEVFNETGLPPPPDKLSDPLYSVNLLGSEVDTDTSHWLPEATKLVPMTKSELTSGEGYERDIRHYEFDISGLGWNYALGDCLAIYPHNPKTQVQEFLEKIGVPEEQVLEIERNTAGKSGFRTPMTAKQLFTEVLDVFGKPSRRFYDFMGIIAEDESQKKHIKHLLSKEGAEELRELSNETMTHADLIEMWPSANVNLAHMTEFIPPIKPRLYSIASSNEAVGDEIHLCIIADDWYTSSGKYQHGLTTGYLRNLKPEGGDVHVAAKLTAGGINVPDDPTVPFVMVGLGTGIAPFRAFLQEREMLRAEGEQVGKMALFFGTRNSSNEYTYGEHLDAWHEDGLITHLGNAFSRDQEQKIYVQDRVAEAPEVLYEYLVKENGYFYLCGPAGRVPAAVRQAVIDAFVKLGGMTPEQADEYVTQMQIEGRYNLDVW